MAKDQSETELQGLGKLNQVIIKETIRPDGSRRIQQDFSNCPSLAEQHTAHLSDINYLMKKYKPDELASYLAARNQWRQEILGHDFSQEPDMQEAMNAVVRSKQEFNSLPEELRSQFQNHLEFLKFIDNPQNAEKLVKLGILSQNKIDKIQIKEEEPEPAELVDEPPQPPKISKATKKGDSQG
nr:MAG: internal scaffolding protein [Microvirus sp.]